MKSKTIEKHQPLDFDQILGIQVNTTSYAQVCKTVINWVEQGQSRMICATSVHGIIIAYDDPNFRAILNAADIVTPDGMPLVWTLRLKGHKNQTRVYGPILMEKLLALAAERGIPVGFLGSTPRVIDKLQEQIQYQHPRIEIAYAFSPPFRLFSKEEHENIAREINHSGAKIMFVGLGCPKQELWMHTNKGEVNAVMVGVGAAFDFIAGEKEQAPHWMQNNGLEWLYRLLKEPQRLWKRYFSIVPRYIILISSELIRSKFHI